MDIAIASSPATIHADAATPVASTSTGYLPPGYQHQQTQPVQHARPQHPSSPHVSTHAHPHLQHQHQQYQLQQQQQQHMQQYPQPYHQPQPQLQTQAQAQAQAQVQAQQHQYYLAHQQQQAQLQLQIQQQHQQQLQQQQLQIRQQQQQQQQQQHHQANGHAPQPITRGRGRGRGRGARGGAGAGGGRGGAAAAASAAASARQVTPPFVYLQRPSNAGIMGGPGGNGVAANGTINGGSPSSTDSGSLPSNHIHIVQTTPTSQMQQAQPHPYPQPHGHPHPHPHPQAHGQGGMLRSHSMLSTTSVPPTLTTSNGPSPNEDTSNPPSTDNEFYTTPPKQILANHHQPQHQASPVASGSSTAPGTAPRVLTAYPTSSSVGSFPYSAQPSTLIQPKEMTMGDLQDVYGYNIEGSIDTHQLLTRWADGFGAMRGGTYDEWVEFVDEHFVQDARFSLGFVGEEMKVYDVPASLLPRVLLTISQNAQHVPNNGSTSSSQSQSSSGSTNHIHIHRPMESSNHNEGNQEEVTESFDISWYYGKYVWRGSISTEVVEEHQISTIPTPVDGANRFGKMEIVILLNEGDMFPEDIIRVLEISQTMEHLSTILAIQKSDNISSIDALKKLVTIDASRPGTAITSAAQNHSGTARENGHEQGPATHDRDNSEEQKHHRHELNGSSNSGGISAAESGGAGAGGGGGGDDAEGKEDDDLVMDEQRDEQGQ
ncbi:hypothetical protein IAT40_005911 [Kwoniella sp. CBS 6097]